MDISLKLCFQHLKKQRINGEGSSLHDLNNFSEKLISIRNQSNQIYQAKLHSCEMIQPCLHLMIRLL